MPSDPYAKYLTPPSGAGAPSEGGGGDPYAKYLTPPGGATATPVQPSSGVSSPIASTALSFADAFAGGLGRTNPFMEMPQGFKQDISQAHQNLGLMDYPVSIAAYMMGPGKVLGPEGMTAGLAGRPIVQAAAEGALAGGVSNFDPNNLSGTAVGAAGGAALGGAAGGVGKGISKLLEKGPPPIDPAAVTAQTKTARDAAYDALNKVPMNPGQVDQAIGGVMANLDPSVQTGMSPGLNRQINDIREAVQQQGQVNAGQVDSWIRQINDAARRERHPTDGIVAGQIDSQLSGLINANGGGDLRTAAQGAHAQYENAQQLQQLLQQAKDFGQGPGNVPQTQAETYYKPGEPGYEAWSQIAQASKPGLDPSYAAAHFGSEIGETVGMGALGFPGFMAGKILGYMGGKKLGKKAAANWQNNALLKAYQAQYPTLTGIQTPSTQAIDPRLGDLIKSVTLGAAY